MLFLPAFYDLFRSFRKRFAFAVVSIIAALCIVYSSNSYILLPSMVIIALYLILYLLRTFRKAYRSSIYEELGNQIKELRKTIEDKGHTFWKREKYPPDTKKYNEQCLSFYTINSGIDIISEKTPQYS